MTTLGSQILNKVSGYLEKKGRLRIGSLWKKYWFVLEGRLLLYYRSKNEYEAISPCKGSINLCPPCTIKPASASSCVFQIEGRATTFTLRAESRNEQERWMQALLTAIDPKSSPSRLSHFRYSFDELPMPYQDNQVIKNGLQRQNSVPDNASTPRIDIIGRLQLIGAHTYGGSLHEFKKQTPKKLQHDMFRNKSDNKTVLNRSLSLHNGSVEVFIENDQYSTIQEENSENTYVNQRKTKTKSLEYIKSIKDNSLSKLGNVHIVENDQYYHSNNKIKTLDSSWIRNKKIRKSESLYERVSGDSYKFNANEVTRLRRKSSNIYERISSEFSNTSEQQIKLNNQFLKIKRKSRESLQSLTEPEYSIPINLEDHNRNSLTVDNEQYMPGGDTLNENLYYKVGPVQEVEELYEDPDVLKKINVSEPLLPPRPEFKKLDSSGENSNNSSINRSKNKKSKRPHLLAQLIKSDRKNETNQSERPKNKRSTSFIHRILRRKEKPAAPAHDIVYEVINNDVEKPKSNDVQMLQELQKMLEARKSLLQKKLSANGIQSTDDMLNKTRTTDNVQIDNGAVTETVHVVIEERPSLPTRQNSQSSIFNNNQQTNLTNTVDLGSEEASANSINTNTDDNQIKTIDEIIEDLNKETSMQDPNHKVKDLIDKFNDLHNEDEIILRRKQKVNVQRSKTISGIPQTHYKSNNHDPKLDSEELTKLLEELSKVTSAPVLTPGVTSSLTTPIVPENELEVIPIRYRRLSDPDYDIPRPHSLLQLQNRSKQMSERAIPATRFFGPLDMTPSGPQSLSSMDPDSLEIDLSFNNIRSIQPNFVIKSSDKNGSISSYKSHKYSKIDNLIYLKPKSILFNIRSHHNKETSFVNIENNKNSISSLRSGTEETFIDSLEPITESTHF